MMAISYLYFDTGSTISVQFSLFVKGKTFPSDLEKITSPAFANFSSQLYPTVSLNEKYFEI